LVDSLDLPIPGSPYQDVVVDSARLSLGTAEGALLSLAQLDEP
jgi:hypothetical protein